jgi:large subunit ribosomal protein L28
LTAAGRIGYPTGSPGTGLAERARPSEPTKERVMPRRCEILGTKPQFGHNVSHSNRKTNRRFDPNLQQVTFYSDALRRPVPLRVTTRAIRTVQKYGGIDPFLVKADLAKLAPEAQRLKRQIHKALGGPLTR